MREPRCYNLVQSKNLWEIAIDFLGRIDDKLMDFNLKFAYVMYKICKLEKLPFKTISKMIFLACFNDVGKLYTADNNNDPTIETYLFLKYFSPVKNYADVLLFDFKNIKMPVPQFEGLIYKTAKDYTTLLLKYNNQTEALNALKEHKKEYHFITLKAIEKFVKKNDIIYEFNSVHYKTIVYKYISKSIFSPTEKNKFITMLSSLFEMYSLQTLYHSKLTAIIGYMLARNLKISKSRAKKIYLAGLCHDLGKVCIPLSILEKPDKLTDREYAIMKRHATYTKEILHSKMDYEIIEMAYRHHEKLDGTGYPNKLSGSYITIDQRILQVSDLISALIAKRSYKEAWSIEKTISILDEMAKYNKIDKKVVECFKNNQNKILKTTAHFTESADKVYEKINKEREMLLSSKDVKI